uniref:Vesicle-fusing ATPase n=1 Tax=Ditylenchus dipsaci TaxID=166011 RepID=A0A915E687_9BILA
MEESKSTSGDTNTTNSLDATPSKFHLSLKDDSSLPARVLAIPQHIRKWTNLELNSDVVVTPFTFAMTGDKDSGNPINTVFLELDFESRGQQIDTISFCSDSLAVEFRKKFNQDAFCVGQEIFFDNCEEDKENGLNSHKEKVIFSAVVKQIFCACFGSSKAVQLHEFDFGLLKQESAIVFVPAENSSLTLHGSNTIKSQPVGTEDKSTDSTSEKKVCPNNDIKLTLVDIPVGAPACPSATKDNRILLNSADYNITEYGPNVTISYGADSKKMVLRAVNSNLHIPKGQAALGKNVAEITQFELDSLVIINQTSKEENKTVAKLCSWTCLLSLPICTTIQTFRNPSTLFNSEEVCQSLKKSINNRFVNKNMSNWVKLEEKYKPKDVCHVSDKEEDSYLLYKCIDKSISFFDPVRKSSKSSEKMTNFDWDFQKMGIGGLDKQFSEIFRRGFASRLFSEKCRQEMGINHLRGVILHGPPGTGKTLLARKIAEMLNAREPKIVNGPEIFGMWLGQSEKNIRNLFLDAEKEYTSVGDKSKLHVIIFDEFDSICPNREKIVHSNRTDSRVVNQLLSKIDGVDQLNNILIIDSEHTYPENELFGNSTAALEHILHHPLISWCPEIDDILSKGDEAIRQTLAKSGCGFVRVLIIGAKFTGKTFLAAKIAKKSAFPFINILTPDSFGTDKLKKLDSTFVDAKASPLSCLVLDNLERIAEYSETFKRFNQGVIFKLNDLLEKRPPEDKRLLVLATCSSSEFIQDIKLKNFFNYVLQVPSINKPEHISKVVDSVNAFTAEEMPLFRNYLSNLPTHIELGIKQIFEALELLDAISLNEKEAEEITPTGQPDPVKGNDEHKKRVKNFSKV